MHPCAPTPGTEILSTRIPVGSHNGDSADGTTHGERAGQPAPTGGKRGSNASLEGFAGRTRSAGPGVREPAASARGPQRPQYRGGGGPHGLQQDVLGALSE